jgi:hypothetical protein
MLVFTNSSDGLFRTATKKKRPEGRFKKRTGNTEEETKPARQEKTVAMFRSLLLPGIVQLCWRFQD